jgi:hypothetical protein
MESGVLPPQSMPAWGGEMGVWSAVTCHRFGFAGGRGGTRGGGETLGEEGPRVGKRQGAAAVRVENVVVRRWL